MDSLLSLAPSDVSSSFLRLSVLAMASGTALGLLGWFVGGMWGAVTSMFDL